MIWLLWITENYCLDFGPVHGVIIFPNVRIGYQMGQTLTENGLFWKYIGKLRRPISVQIDCRIGVYYGRPIPSVGLFFCGKL